MFYFAASLLSAQWFLYLRRIPPFARQYGTVCSTCHINFPRLNDFGKAFKDTGFCRSHRIQVTAKSAGEFALPGRMGK